MLRDIIDSEQELGKDLLAGGRVDNWTAEDSDSWDVFEAHLRFVLHEEENALVCCWRSCTYVSERDFIL